MSLETLKSKTCPACNSTGLEYPIGGQIICRGCGLINSEIEVKEYVRSEVPQKPKKQVPNIPFTDDFSRLQNLLRVSGSTERNAALTLYYITKLAEELYL